MQKSVTTGTQSTNTTNYMTDDKKTTAIGVLFGTWNRYEVVDEEETDFHSRYDCVEYTDDAHVVLKIIWDDAFNELDVDDMSYPPYPSEWKEGVACLEASHAFFEVDGEITDLDQIEVKGVNIIINGDEYQADDWDMQEIEEAIDIATGKEVQLWG